MTRRRALSVVSPGSPAPKPPAPPKFKTIQAAAEHSTRALLILLRERLALELDKGVPPHAMAPLTRQLRDIDRELHEIEEMAASDSDELPVDEHFDASEI